MSDKLFGVLLGIAIVVSCTKPKHIRLATKLAIAAIAIFAATLVI